MRVLMVSWEYPPVLVGGLGRHVAALSANLARAGHDVLVLARQPAGTDAVTHPTQEVVVGGVRVLRVAEEPAHLQFEHDLVAWTLAMAHAMLRAALPRLQGWRPDLVHAHDWLVAHPAITLAEALDVPLVATLHATEAGRHAGWLSTPLNRQVHSVEWWLAQRADALITCSQAMRREVAGLFDLDADAVTVLHNGIESRRWRARPSEVIDAPVRYGSPPGPLLLYLGRLEYEKGVHDLVAAMPRIRRRHPSTRLLVAGTGTAAEFLAEQAAAHRVRRSVQLLGHLPDREIAALLGAVDAVVLPSRYEPFGIVALEAAAAGAPLVASSAGGLAELVIDAVTGLSFAPGDVAAIAATVGAALADPAAARTRARAARDRLADEFDWQRITAQTVDVYAAAHVRPVVALGRPKIPTGNAFGHAG